VLLARSVFDTDTAPNLVELVDSIALEPEVILVKDEAVAYTKRESQSVPTMRTQRDSNIGTLVRRMLFPG